jgi:hypothetical protein
MTESEEFDLAKAGLAWRAQLPPPDLAPAIRNRIRRQTRFMWLTTASELGVLLAFATFTAWLLSAGVTTAEAALLGVLWALSLGTLAFSVWNRRGSWRAPTEQPEAYVELLERRAGAKLRAAIAVRWLVVAQAAAVTALVAVRPASSFARGSAAAALALILAFVYIGWSFWYAARARAELEQAADVRTLLRSNRRDDGTPTV